VRRHAHLYRPQGDAFWILGRLADHAESAGSTSIIDVSPLHRRDHPASTYKLHYFVSADSQSTMPSHRRHIHGFFLAPSVSWSRASCCRARQFAYEGFAVITPEQLSAR
jgi:hypothetical protein